MKVLFTVLSEHPQPTRDARRLIGYERLVVFTPDPESDALARIREMESITGDEVEVVEVDPHDALGTLQRMEETIDTYRGETVRFQVNARENRLTHPALLCCFQHGIEAWFCHEEGAQRLPVVQTVDLVERFPAHERTVLHHLDDAIRREALVEAVDLQRGRVLDALLNLKAKGLLEVDGATVALNDRGRYFRDHVVRADAEASASKEEGGEAEPGAVAA